MGRWGNGKMGGFRVSKISGFKSKIRKYAFQ
jgi:hypothetical protein